MDSCLDLVWLPETSLLAIQTQGIASNSFEEIYATVQVELIPITDGYGWHKNIKKSFLFFGYYLGY